MALRAVYIFRQRFDSDEPQHLHVVWGWSHGLVQYRDVFDNQMPLFHLASVPLLRLAGEHPAALFVARAAMLPLFALTVLAVRAIARALFDERTGLWAALLAAGSPGFFLSSVEYRPDLGWAVAWLLTLCVLVRPGALTAGRSVVAGLLLGTALASRRRRSSCWPHSVSPAPRRPTSARSPFRPDACCSPGSVRGWPACWRSLWC